MIFQNLSKVLPFAILSLASTQAYAETELMLFCQIEGKQERLEVSVDAQNLIYAYGPSGQADMFLVQPYDSSALRPWGGVGSAIFESVVFQNNEYEYEVYTAIDRMTETHDIYAGVSVYKNGQELVNLPCGEIYEFPGAFWVEDLRARFE